MRRWLRAGERPRGARHGWLVRLSVRLAKADVARLSEAAGRTVRAELAARIAAQIGNRAESALTERDQHLLVVRPGRRKSDHDSPDPVVRELIAGLGAPIPTDGGPVFPRVSAAFTAQPCDPGDERVRAELAVALGEADGAGEDAAIEIDLDTGERRRLRFPDRSEARMIGMLKRAVDGGQVVMRYQPVVALAARRVTGFEALMRIGQEGGGELSPAHFIGIAERSGMIHELGREALRLAADEARRWPAGARVAVNVAASQLDADDFAAVAEAAFGDALPRLTVELTESALIAEMPRARATLDALRGMGARLALDDFGVEYSNLAWLRDLPVDVVKIDRSFLERGPHPERAATILAKVVELAHLLGAQVVAEGVATPRQADVLGSIGVDYGQGSLFGPPVPPDEAARMLGAP